MPCPMIVPVVAHRMFGRRHVGTGLRDTERRTPPGPFGPGVPLGPELETRAEVDTSHGTRRQSEEIERLFHEGERPAHTRGWSVNRLWQPAGVQFVLVGIVDEMIDSHYADYLVNSRTVDLSGRDYERAINVYFFRQLHGAWGFVGEGRAFMADRWDPSETAATREETWRHDVITMSHELGHVLQLNHRDETDNVMFGLGTRSTSHGLTPAQGLFARQRARAFRRPWYRHLPDDDLMYRADVVVPRAAAHAGERLPTYD